MSRYPCDEGRKCLVQCPQCVEMDEERSRLDRLFRPASNAAPAGGESPVDYERRCSFDKVALDVARVLADVFATAYPPWKQITMAQIAITDLLMTETADRNRLRTELAEARAAGRLEGLEEAAGIVEGYGHLAVYRLTPGAALSYVFVPLDDNNIAKAIRAACTAGGRYGE